MLGEIRSPLCPAQMMYYCWGIDIGVTLVLVAVEVDANDLVVYY